VNLALNLGPRVGKLSSWKLKYSNSSGFAHYPVLGQTIDRRICILDICLTKNNLFKSHYNLNHNLVFRYASLYFCVGMENDDNELLSLEVIHRYVELLDKYFGSVSNVVVFINKPKRKTYIYKRKCIIIELNTSSI